MGGATSTSTSTPASSAAFRARAADGSSGATTAARPDKPDLAGDRGEASAVRAADLQEPVAHLHAGHADDQEVGVASFRNMAASKLSVSAFSLPQRHSEG